jgi:hypothetical protein
VDVGSIEGRCALSIEMFLGPLPVDRSQFKVLACFIFDLWTFPFVPSDLELALGEESELN